MAINVSDDDIIHYATSCRSMRDAAKACGMSQRTFNRHAKRLNVYDGEKWKIYCDNKREKEKLSVPVILVCQYCTRECHNKLSLKTHERMCPSNPNRNYVSYTIGRKSWNTGLSKETDERLRKKGEALSQRYKKGELVPNWMGHTHTDETKQRISESMKLAQKEGRAYNIGTCRHNNEHSWPEKWLIQVLHNEFNLDEHIDYITEYSFHRFSLDFAFVDKKMCIEVDGKQHLTDTEQRIRDQHKDELLKQDGWTELRIPWLDCYKNPKEWIERIRQFLLGV